MNVDSLARLAKAFGGLRRNKKAFFGLLMLISTVSVAVFAPLLTPYTPDDMRAGPLLFQKPCRAHPFGTDRFGRDVFCRTIFGTRISLGIALQVCVLSFLLGVPPGLLAGYRGGLIDNLLMRVADLLFTIPSVLMALFIAAIIGPGVATVRIALSVAYTPGLLRLSRASAMSMANREFVTAARSIGAKEFRIITRHILPNCAAPLIVQTAMVMSYAVLAEATLSYLGVGVSSPTPSWGVMLRDGAEGLYSAPYLSIFPGLAVTYLVLSFNLLGDGLRDLLDPYLRGRR